MLPADWTETTITDPYAMGGSSHVYRKAAGDLVLTLNADFIDCAEAYGDADLAEKLNSEWQWFIATRRRHAEE